MVKQIENPRPKGFDEDSAVVDVLCDIVRSKVLEKDEKETERNKGCRDR